MNFDISCLCIILSCFVYLFLNLDMIFRLKSILLYSGCIFCVMLLAEIFYFFPIRIDISKNAHFLSIPYVHSHNLNVLIPDVLPKNITQPKVNSPVIIIVNDFDGKMTRNTRHIIYILKSLQLTFKIIPARPSFIELNEILNSNFVRLIIFQNFLVYFSFPDFITQKLNKYCRTFNVGVVGFFARSNHLKTTPGYGGFVEVIKIYFLDIL